MSTELRLPPLPLGDSETRIARWLKQPGDALASGDPLLIVLGERAEVLLPAPDRGSLKAILAPEGTLVAAGAPLARIAVAERATPEPEAAEPITTVPLAHEVITVDTSDRPRCVSPVASRIATAAQIDITRLTGSGPGGRIVKSDVLAALSPTTDHRPPTTDYRESAEDRGSESENSLSLGQSLISNLQSPSPMRRAIAAHMVRSRASSPHALTAMEVDMGQVADTRARLKAGFAARGLELTYTACIALAAVAALSRHPLLNSSWSDAGIVMRRRVHLGVAAALPDGLLTPVVRDAQDLNLRGMARAVGDLAHRARSGALRPGETSGGTFTLTNPGGGALWFGTPIINQPQGAILGVGALHTAPLVISERGIDRIAIRPVLLLTLAYDARVLDQHHADAFLHDVKNRLEQFNGSV